MLAFAFGEAADAGCKVRTKPSAKHNANQGANPRSRPICIPSRGICFGTRFADTSPITGLFEAVLVRKTGVCFLLYTDCDFIKLIRAKGLREEGHCILR